MNERRHPVIREEAYISVDVETAGPNPSTFSMLSMLYQVWSLVRTLNDTLRSNARLSRQVLLNQADDLILAAVEALEGEEEQEIVRHLLRLRSTLSDYERGDETFTAHAEAARAELINVVNNFFYEKLTSMPTLKTYIQCLETGEDPQSCRTSTTQEPGG